MRGKGLVLVLILCACSQQQVPIGALCSDVEPGECPECTMLGDSALPQCTMTCMSDEQCEELHPDATCVVTCFRRCDGDDACPGGTGCLSGFCAPLCSSDADCREGNTCSGRFCVNS